MEKRLNNKLYSYLTKFKQDVADKIKEGNSQNDLITYIYEYEGFSVDTTDFQKRKRINNVVPLFDRCCAKRMNSSQCTRRKQPNSEYCGTHIKGTPHGIMEQNTPAVTLKQVDVWCQEINGIMWYIDSTGNVYSTEDILENKQNPNVIANYEMVEGVYHIINVKEKLGGVGVGVGGGGGESKSSK